MSQSVGDREDEVSEEPGEDAIEGPRLQPPTAPTAPSTAAAAAAATSAVVFLRFTAEMLYVTVLLPLCLGLVLAWSLQPFITFEFPSAPNPHAVAVPTLSHSQLVQSPALGETAWWVTILLTTGLWILGSAYLLASVSFEFCVLRPMLRPGVDLLVFWGHDVLDEEQDTWERMLRDIMKESVWRTGVLYCKALCRDVLFITCLVRTPLKLAQHMVPADVFPLAFFPSATPQQYSVGAHVVMCTVLVLLLWALCSTFDFEALAQEACHSFLYATLPPLGLEGLLRQMPPEAPASPSQSPKHRGPPTTPGTQQATDPTGELRGVQAADAGERTQFPAEDCSPDVAHLEDEDVATPTSPVTFSASTSCTHPQPPFLFARTLLLLLLAWGALLVLELTVIIVPLLVSDLTQMGAEISLFEVPPPAPSPEGGDGSTPLPPLPRRRVDLPVYLVQLCFLIGALQPTEFLLSIAMTFSLLGRICLAGCWCAALLLRWMLRAGQSLAGHGAGTLRRPVTSLARLRQRLFRAAYDDLYLEGMELHHRPAETPPGTL
eukprot:GGOE01037199.1.p1 GENE.GGOE01037199.1~~GGOE01037199.1.p1  ORF type:complete len:579 (-),score=166.09 GGOE01037199.1:280-1920(-)